MTVRGERTKAALIRATASVVAARGYHQATTRAIADEAGVSEATIYRHFPDKRSLFFAAALDGHQEMLAWMTGLPARAGSGRVADTLTECLVRLAELRANVIPLELALMSDPTLGASAPAPAFATAATGPPLLLAQYLSAEQAGGRVNPDLDPAQLAMVLLATLFGLAASPLTDGDTLAVAVKDAVAVLMVGMGSFATSEEENAISPDRGVISQAMSGDTAR
ncbi:TetR/AcrR family transcriptional regulator [Lapillicoccus sp.]|uniref:TetR/AcrR family transcriptional regulator n=1 Tax=Lapillicoccus sp. TaxID=1909287 RepID=UPI0025D5B544|nr:TetR/AcrR family transcriptional regulator [Lapillicoccus sp.]